jgi:hypothetical protein
MLYYNHRGGQNSRKKEVKRMFTMIYAVRMGNEVKEVKAKKSYNFIEDARVDAESIKDIVAMRVFDKAGLRVYSKRMEKRG